MEAKEPFSVYIMVRFDFPGDGQDTEAAEDEASRALDTAGIESRFGRGIDAVYSQIEPQDLDG